MRINTEVLKTWIKLHLNNLTPNAGLIYGIPASRYLELDERPIERHAADGIVAEFWCDDAEAREIIQETDPVDYVRRPDGKSTIFIWCRSKAIADELRLNRGQIVLAMIEHIFEMDNDELAETFATLTGHTIRDPECTDETGDIWKCDTSFDHLVEPRLSKTMAYLQSQLPQ